MSKKTTAHRDVQFDARMGRRRSAQRWAVIGVALTAIVPLVASLAVPLLGAS